MAAGAIDKPNEAATYAVAMTADTDDNLDKTLDHAELNIIITESNVESQNGEVTYSVDSEAITDNGDGSYTYKAEDGTEFKITSASGSDGSIYKIADGILKLFYSFGSVPEKIEISDIKIEAVE